VLNSEKVRRISLYKKNKNENIFFLNFEVHMKLIFIWSKPNSSLIVIIFSRVTFTTNFKPHMHLSQGWATLLALRATLERS
jgi:hypothetical protein